MRPDMVNALFGIGGLVFGGLVVGLVIWSGYVIPLQSDARLARRLRKLEEKRRISEAKRYEECIQFEREMRKSAEEALDTNTNIYLDTLERASGDHGPEPSKPN